MSAPNGHFQTSDNQAQWDLMVERHSEGVARYARHLTRNRQDAEDIVQEVFLRAFGHLLTAKPRNMAGWLNRIALNLVRDRARRNSRVRIAPLSDTMLDRCLGFAPSAETAALDLHLREDLRNALARLPPHNRIAVLHRDVDQLTYSEIAALTGVNRNTVASRIRRGREQLAAQLDVLRIEPEQHSSTPTTPPGKEHNHERT